MIARAACLAVLACVASSARADEAALKAAKLVPAAVDAALLLDGADALAGPRAFFGSAGKLARALDPQEIGRMAREQIGVDLLAAPDAQELVAPPDPTASPALPAQRWGLAPAGPRAVAFWLRSAALTLPVADEAAARKAAERWVADRGKPRGASLGAISAQIAGKAKRTRLFAMLKRGGELRLILAAGAEAQKVAAAVAGVGRRRPALIRKADVAAAIARARGPAVLYAAAEAPLRAAVLSIGGAAKSLTAQGVLLPLGSDALLAGPPAAANACEGAPLVCVRAGLGPAGKSALGRLLELWAAFALPRRDADALAQRAFALAKSLTGPAALRVEALEVEQLSRFPGPLWAAAFRAGGLVSAPAADFALPAPRELCVKATAGAAWIGDACDRPAPALAAAGDGDSMGAVDLPGLAAALERASPLAALKGQLPAAAYTARILFGRLLAGSESLGGTAHPSADFPGAADVSLSWTLR